MNFFEFANCTTEDEYLDKFLQEDTEEENAYQLAYDMSNDWMIDTPTWDMVEKAYLVGIKAARRD